MSLIAVTVAIVGCGGDGSSATDTAGGDASADVSVDVADTSARPDSVRLPSTSGLVPDSVSPNPGCSALTETGSWRPNLADSGCYGFADSGAPIIAEAIPYQVNAPLWADQSEKRRYVLLPEGAMLGWNATSALSLPVGTVLIKEFWLDGSRVESRFVERTEDEWLAATFAWNETQTDATLVETATEISVGEHQWLLPGTADCTSCHTRAADFVLGFRGDQLYREADMFGLGEVNQVAALNALGLFEEPLPDDLPLVPLAAPDSNASLDHRARSYLASNCGNCHQPGGAPHADIDLRIDTALDRTNGCDVYPIAGDLGLRADARIIAPGNAAHSVLSLRMNRRDADGMPQLGSFEVDDAAVSLIDEWIDSLEDCFE